MLFFDEKASEVASTRLVGSVSVDSLTQSAQRAGIE
jgi:hypothetical protein